MVAAATDWLLIMKTGPETICSGIFQGTAGGKSLAETGERPTLSNIGPGRESNAEQKQRANTSPR
jgi:hypothetical protein